MPFFPPLNTSATWQSQACASPTGAEGPGALQGTHGAFDIFYGNRAILNICQIPGSSQFEHQNALYAVQLCHFLVNLGFSAAAVRKKQGPRGKQGGRGSEDGNIQSDSKM